MSVDTEKVVKAVEEKFEEKYDPLSEKIEENATKIDKLAERDFSTEAKKDWKDKFGGKMKELAKGEKEAVNVNASGWKWLDMSSLESKSTETTSSFSGLVPQSWLRQVFQIPYDYGAFLNSGVRMIPMSETVNYATINNRPSFTWKSQGGGEGSEAGGTDLDTSSGSVSREGAIATVKMSNESLRMTNISLADFFTQEIRRAWAGEVDQQAFISNGAPFTGLKNLSGINSVSFSTGETSFDNIDRDYLIKVLGSVKSSVANSAGWFMSNNMKHFIHRKLTDSNGQPLLDLESDTLLGYPVWLSDKLPTESDSSAETNLLYFGSTRVGTLYSVEGVRIAMSEHADFSNDNVVFRATVDVVLKHILASAFVKLSSGAAA